MVAPADLTRLGPARGARIAVVGGCGGIGRAVVRGLLANGAQVAVLDLPGSLAEMPPPHGVAGYGFDGRRADEVESAFAALGRDWAELDGLVVLSGYTAELQPVAEIDIAAFDDVLAGNLRLTALVCRAAVPLLRAGRPEPGRRAIVTMATGLVHRPQPGYGAYVAAKAGVVALSRSLAAELAPVIRVNIVAPGGIDTAFMRGGRGRGGSDEGPTLRVDIQRYAAMVPLGRVGVPDDVAGPILFLLSDAARYISGEVLQINGGALTV